MIHTLWTQKETCCFVEGIKANVQVDHNQNLEYSMSTEDAEEPPSADAGNEVKDNQRHLRVGGFDISVDNEKASLLGVATSAIVLLIAVGIGQFQMSRTVSYGYAVGAIALILALLGLIPNSNATLDKYSLYLNYFLFVWCFVGACVLTFGDGPFKETGNGYFASWALTVFSAMSMGISNLPLSENVRKATEGMNIILGLGASAFVTMIACIPYIDDANAKREAIFGLIVSVLTILVVATFVYAKMRNNLQMKKVELPIYAMFACLWIIVAGMTTFRAPFATTGNGYFSTWCGAVLAVKATISAKSESPEQSE
jgi:hypothetical protein